ncbi:MAG: hypothetical protein Q8Q59_00720 [Luteolibacter sp.]|nr:hypothetical protein [Luteolibacter sp.]
MSSGHSFAGAFECFLDALPLDHRHNAKLNYPVPRKFMPDTGNR